MKRILIIVLTFLYSTLLFAQQYTVNGNASQVNCHCYILTPDLATQSGSVWNNYKIDLSNSFTFVFGVNLGSTDANGADGIAFVLQPISTSIGGNGSGLGFGGISPSIGITLDTYQNISPDNDPVYDHIAIQRNGILDHLSTDNLAGPVPVSSISDNIEDNLDHQLKISWDAATKTLSTFFDGVPRVSVVNDLVATTFSGDPLVYWGFTGSTGFYYNLQKFCTSLTPHWNFSATQKRCVNEPITFYDSTIAFAPLIKIYWDFGDGSNIDSVDVNPTHTYTIAGDYTVIQTVLGADGCEETNTQIVRIGSKPTAGFYTDNTCVLNLNHFIDTSHVTVGNINTYWWDFDNSGLTGSLNPDQTTYSTPGIKNIKHVVTTLEGCVSDTLITPIRIYARSIADFNFTDSVCLGSPITFTDQSVSPDGQPINGWVWFIDGNAIGNVPSVTYTFLTPGNHTVIHFSTENGNADCLSAQVVKNVFIRDKPVAHFTYNTICQGTSSILTDSSYSSDAASVNQWWWNLGNSTISTSQNPSTTYNNASADTILLVVTTINGCKSDTLKQSVYINAKPTAKFGINAVVCFGTPIQFSDSSFVSGGTINAWSWIYNGSLWNTAQNPSGLFNVGPQTISLAVASNAGCRSDTVSESFIVNPKAEVAMNFNDQCKNTPVRFTGADLTGGNMDQWHWSFGDGGIATTMNTSHTYTANGTYSVELYGIDKIGCQSATLQKNIIIYGTNAFAGNDTIAAAGQLVQLNAIGGLSYTWSPATGLSNTSIANPVAILSTTQTYTVKAFTPEGCESYDDITIKIYKAPDIYLPTAFTPNDDGLNDIFRGIPVGLKEFRYMKIYNRWGQEVFSTTDYRVGWDGTWKGEKQGNGVFVVIANGIDFTGKIINKKSTVMLIR